MSGHFRKNEDPVFFVLHDGTKQGYLYPHSEDWEIIPAINVEEGDRFISKTANDEFYNTTFKADLQKLGITELVITGCATDFCVDATIKLALANDFNLTIISDAHTTADRPNLSAKQIIDYFNWMWYEMIPTKGNIKVVSFEEYLTT